MSFEVPARSKVAIIGNHKSGRTSIPGVLLSLYKPQSGTVKIDDRDINEYSQKHLRSQIYHVTN